MAKRFLVAFGLILLYMGIWALVFLPVVLIFRESDLIIIGIVFAVLILSSIGFIPYLNFVSKKSFYFKGQGEAVPEKKLRTLIKGINNHNVPVTIRERKNKLVASWKYVDAKWWETLAKAGLTKLYELHMKFNDDRKEVILIDVMKSVSWGAGPSQVRLRGGFFRGIATEYEIGKQWGIKENFELGKIYNYKFTNGEIKYPIMNSILRNGWDVRFAMW